MHRDIKSENILVAEKTVDGIYVKFADFGFFKTADTPKSFCDTLKWTASESYLKAVDSMGVANDIYSVVVDIWSLGIVIVWIECDGLSIYEQEWKTDPVAWIRAVKSHVVDKYNKQGGELLWLVVDSMLVEDCGGSTTSPSTLMADGSSSFLTASLSTEPLSRSRSSHSLPITSSRKAFSTPKTVERVLL